MADLVTLTAEALHNALAMVTSAYGAALADKNREITLLKGQAEHLEKARQGEVRCNEELTALLRAEREKVKALEARLGPLEATQEGIPSR